MRGLRTALVTVGVVLAVPAAAQSASSASFSLESQLLTGAVRGTSASFAADSCISPGPGGAAHSPSFALVTGCGAMMMLSAEEQSALGLVVAEEPVIVPTLSTLSQLLLFALLAAAGALLAQRPRPTRNLLP